MIAVVGSPAPFESRARARRRLAEWLRLALLAGTVLFALHVAAVVAGAANPEDREFAAWHVGLTLVRSLSLALVAGALAAAIALLPLRRAGLAVLACTALFLAVIPGWPLEDARRLPDLDAGSGRLVLFFSALAAWILAAVLVRVGRSARLVAETSVDPVRASRFVPVLVVAVLVPSASWVLLRSAAPVRTVRERVRELLAGPPSWKVTSRGAKSAPYVGSLTPSLDAQVDGGDLESLILPPPSTVRFVIPPDSGQLRLRASAGVDRRFRWQLEHAPPGAHVSLEIAVNGRPRYLAVVPADGPESTRAWHHAGGREGLEVEPGDVVTLRTELSPPGAAVSGKLPLLAGFGRMEIERTVRRPCAPPSGERPNLVLVVMDTLRADELSCYGHAGRATPRLDELAARGVLYERACATSSWTWPSTASILTGLAPEAHGVVDDDACYLDAGVETVAEALEDEDYVTAAFACNPLLDPVKNFDQGFETYDYARDFRKSAAVLPAIEAWLAAHAEARFFLYLHFVDTHEPVEPDPEDCARVGTSRTPPAGCPERPTVEYRPALLRGEGLTPAGETNPDLVVPLEHQRWIRSTYSAAVSTADRRVGAVLDALAKLGLEGKTVVAFTADHGEELFDHGFLGHDHTLHQELVRVPLILAGPGVPRGVRSTVPVSNRQLAWTLARRGGGSLPAVPRPVDLAAPERVEPRPLFFSTEHGWWWNEARTTILGVEDWPWVLHSIPRGLPWGAAKGADPGEGEVRLYDLEADPGERRDLSKERSDLVEPLLRALVDHTRKSLAARTGRVRSVGDATLDLLRRFGYAGDPGESPRERR